jgi:hypothetical protein
MAREERKYIRAILSSEQSERTKDIILNLENEPDIKEWVDICAFRHLAKLTPVRKCEWPLEDASLQRFRGHSAAESQPKENQELLT